LNDSQDEEPTMNRLRRAARDRANAARLRTRTPRSSHDLQPLEPRRLLAADVVINEIMHHAPSQDPREEFVELYNRGDAPADLTGWRFDQGVTYAFTGGTLDAGGYLVVAANVATFAAKYPGVTNVVGNWTGGLSNNRESIRIIDALGNTVDRVEYAESGDWAVRRRGPLDHGHQGWEWYQAADGGGPSLELINPFITNDTGENWFSSTPPGGTPGGQNSVMDSDVAPLVRDVSHSPAIPHSTDSVTVTSRVTDEAGAPASAAVFYRVDGSGGGFTQVTMRDDGAGGDATAADGVYTAVLPPRADRTIVEFYVRAADAAGNARTWPAPTEGTQGANALYQVDDTTYSGNLPIYRIVMTEAERLELADIGNGGPSGDHLSNAAMNATFIGVDGTGTDVRYEAGVRNRGHGSRLGPPNNYRVNFPADRSWHGVTAVNFNAYYVHSQLLGSAVHRLAGVEAPDAVGVELRVNGTDLAEPGGPRMFGSYVMVEEADSDFTAEHFPGDGGGNYYAAFRTDATPQNEANLRYEGTNPLVYQDRYFKQTNKSENDWSDLIRLTDVLNNAPDATYLQDVSQVIDVQQWMRYLALDALMLNREGGLDTGVGDDYGLYRGETDTRFKLVPHDLDTLFNQGVATASVNQSIFSFVGDRTGAGGVVGLRRLLTNPQTAPLVYQAFVDVIRDTFNPTVLNPVVDRFLGPFVPASNIAAIKQFIVDRSAAVLSQIPRQFTVSSALPISGPYHRTTSPVAQLNGTADAVLTRSVTVNGQVANYNAVEGTWAMGSTTGAPATLVPTGSTWKYNASGGNLGTAWTLPTYSDANWPQGPAQLGWGDGDERTVVPQTPTRVTTYFRLKFNVADPTQFASLNLRLLRDDGAVAYLNGQRVVTSNMPATVAYDTRPTATVSNADESRFYPYSIDPALLQPGENTLAVEIHDVVNSTDISFDLGLEGVRRGTGTGSGVALNPGVNRLTVQAYDGLNGTGNVVNSGFVDVWYDAPGGSASTAPVDAVSVLTPDSYRPGTPVLVQVQAQYNGQVQRELWDATATLSVNRPDVFLSTSEVTLRNGLGSALVTLTGPGVTSGAAFTLTASIGTHQVSKAMTSLASLPVTNVSGTLSGAAVTWSGVVHVTGDVIVPAGTTLTIQPGTLVLLNGVASGDTGTDIQVNGTIRSLGTADDPVVITAWDPNLPWGELRHTNAQPSLYQYTLISRAGNSPGGGHTGKGPVLRPTNSTITFDHVAITDNVGKIGQATGSNLTFQNSELSRSIAGAEIGSTQLLQEWTWTTEMRGVDDNDGIYLNAQSAGQTITLRHNVFAGVDDDGVDTLASTVLIDDAIIRDSKDKGVSTLGGVVTINNSLLADNTLLPEDGTSATISAKPGQGQATATVNMDHTTVVAPVVGIEGRDKFGEPTLRVIYNVTNSIIRAADAVRTDYNPADIHISYSNVSETWPGTGNNTADPLFTNPAAHDFHLRPGSPALNAGDPASPNDPDGTRADQGYWRTGPKDAPAAGGVIAAGTLPAGLTVLSPQTAWRVTGDVIVPAGSTLQILPGTTVFFDPGAGITVQGGRLIAEGTRFNEVRFTLYPGATGTWDGLQFLNTMQDNRLTWAVLEYGGSATTNAGMVGLTGSNLLIDHAYFDHADHRRIRTENSSLVVRNSEFADIFPGAQAPTTNNLSEHIWGNGIAPGGQLLIENNVFGTTKGHNDAIDLGVAQLPGPIPQIIGNLFKGGGDDALDLECDAIIDGNTFLHFHKDAFNTDAGNSNAMSLGGGRDYTVVRNVFYDVDHAALVKDGAFATFTNNTVSGTTGAAIYFELPGDSLSVGRGAAVDSSIFHNVPALFSNQGPATVITVNRSVVPAADVSRGTGNTSEDPRLKDVAALDFSLRPGSAALGSGANGLDMGARVPAGASLSGAPAGTTGRTGATITVGGPGVVAYRYKLDNGAWSAETPLSTPINLSGLSNGTHTLYAVGRNPAGAWQPDATATTRTWTVNTSAPSVKINELLASNNAAVEHGGYPDLIELFNDSDSTVDLSNMSITDDPANPRKFVFASGTTIAPGGYLVLYGDNRVVAGEVHVRFNLRGGGESVWLYDSTGRGGALLDSVVFGPQITDLSIGRLPGGNWGLTRPTFGAANVAQRTGDPSTLTLNEWLTDGITPDFVELYNPDALPVPMAGLSLTDHIGGAPNRSPIAPLSFIPARGWFYFTADGDEQQGADHADFQLGSDGGQIGLIDSASHRPIDRVVYGPQRTGVSQGRTPDGGAGVSTFNTPTPGASNLQVAPSTLPLRITEIMYHPVEPAPGSEYLDEDFEFLELQNTGGSPISLSGVKLTVGVTFVFPDMTLQPGQYVLVVGNRPAFESVYGAGRPVIGVYDGDLDNSGERLRLEDGSGATILDFFYGDNAWYPLTDGAGYSLAINNAQAPAATWGLQSSWHASNTPLGTPGAPDGAAPVANVLAKQVFYNHSAFDGGNPAATAADDNAIATDKYALLPGQSATFANYTNYSRGLNGVFIDFLNFAATPSLSDFVFRTGNRGDPSTWVLAPNPTITVRGGAGVGGSSRLALVWADNAIQNNWLQVTVKAGGNTGLAAPQVFYFGNFIGDVGDSPRGAAVNATDVMAVRRNVSSRSVPVTNRYDLNKDGRVTNADVLIARAAETRRSQPLLTAPPAAVEAPLTTTGTALFGDTRIAPRRRATELL
jgi:hypothetical protein